MNVAEKLEALVREGLNVDVFALENESHMHSGPATESHFKLALVSSDFDAMPKVRRHQKVYGLVAELIQNPIHALALHLYTPAEWQSLQGLVPASPNCKGGGK